MLLHSLDLAAADSGNMVVAAAVEAPNSHHHTVAADTAVDTAAAAVAVAGSIRLVAAGVGVIADIPGCPKLGHTLAAVAEASYSSCSSTTS